jgi:hypothetical protein
LRGFDTLALTLATQPAVTERAEAVSIRSRWRSLLNRLSLNVLQPLR